MADDELLLSIDKCFWPKGVMRGLTPVLRSLGDRHGNLVIAAQPLKGVIMVKGAPDLIEGVKAELKEILEEHFPDAPLPDELTGGGSAAHAPEAPPPADEEEEEEEEEVAPAPAPAAPAPAAPAPVARALAAPAAAPAPTRRSSAPKPLAKRKSAVERAVEAAAALPRKEVQPCKRPRPQGAPPALLWECMRRTSSFIRKPAKELKKTFSAEPLNLTGMHSPKWSGLASFQAIDVRPKKFGSKETIVFLRSGGKTCSRRRPKSSTYAVGLSKCPPRGMAALDTEVAGRFYRRDCLSVAREKYIRVQRSFKKKKARSTKSGAKRAGK